MKRVVLCVCCLLIWASEARSQTVTDKRVWAGVTMQGSVRSGSPWRWTFESFVRSREGVREVDVIGLRPTLIYAIDTHSSVGAGYALAPSFPEGGGTTFERRAYGQYIWTGSAAGATLTLRTRVEARFIPGNSGTLGRVRQQTRFSRPIHAGSKVALLAYDEWFVHLNNTSRSPRGFDQNRAFGGLAVTIASPARLDIGYLNQFYPGHRGAASRMNHVLSCTLALSF